MLIAARLFVLLLLGLAFWNPKLAWKNAPMDLFLLLDDSESMKIAWNRESWRQIGSELRKFPGAARLILIRYAAQPATESGLVELESEQAKTLLDADAPPRGQPIDGSSTNIEAALAHALRLTQPQRQSVFLVASDGLQTRGDATLLLRELNQRGTPILFYTPGSRLPQADQRIESFFVPDKASAGQQVPVTAMLRSDKDAKAELQLWVAGELRERQSIMLRAGQTATAQFITQACRPGPCPVSLVLASEEDAIPQNNRRDALIEVQGPRPLLYLQAQANPAPLADSLEKEGWDVHVASPDAFPREIKALEAFGSVVLDDIPFDAMPAAAWQALDESVRFGGLGLVVLGGPHSFAAGGYRQTLLEELLPVTAEAANPKESAAVLFVVDKSGSMDKEEAGASRIALARKSVLETLKTLGAEDQTGLIAFDAEPRLLLPLQRYADPAKAFTDGFAINAMGGTKLAPALDLAIGQLKQAQTAQRLLILVTDGVLEEKDLEPLKAKIVSLNIDLISLLVGSAKTNDVLGRLTQLNQGKMLRVERMAELPRLMSEEAASRRNPDETGVIQPRIQTPPPFLADAARWPELAGYMVTKPRPGATVYLVSEKQDPLMAAHYEGAGRVVVIPGGLGGWAENWPRWTEWGRFAGGLAQWVGNDAEGLWDVAIHDLPGEVALSIDTHESGPAGLGWVTVTDPAGASLQIQLSRTAVGFYSARLPATQKGIYRFTARIGEHHLHRSLIHDPQDEFFPSAASKQALQRWRAEKMLRPFPQDGLADLAKERDETGTRPVWLGLALSVYLALILIERLGLFPGTSRIAKK